MVKLGIIIYSNDRETVWNAFRLGVYTANKSNSAKIFLLAKGVECESLDTEKFKIKSEMQTFVLAGGEIFACGTCLKLRQSEGSEICPLSTMDDLYSLIDESDKVVSF